MIPKPRRRFRIRKRRYREASKIILKRRRPPIHPVLWVVAGLVLLGIVREVLRGNQLAGFLLATILILALFRLMRSWGRR